MPISSTVGIAARELLRHGPAYVLYALMDSDSVAGAYRFDIVPGAPHVMDIDAAMFIAFRGGRIARIEEYLDMKCLDVLVGAVAAHGS